MTRAVPVAPLSGARLSASGEPAWDVALLFPLQGSWTEDDYLGLNTNCLVEFSDGCIEVLPMPTKSHQRIVRHLFLALQQFVATQSVGEVFFAPLPVRVAPRRFREPDIVYLRPERPEYRGQPDGADLVIEVMSEGEENRRRDLEAKSVEYAQAGIAEYWIVDPENRQITVLVLDGYVYRSHGTFGLDAIAQSVLLDGFAVAVKDAFSAIEETRR